MSHWVNDAPAGPGSRSAGACRAFWRRVTAVYELSPAEEAMLARCCRTLDVLDRLDAALLDADDLMVNGQRRADEAAPGRLPRPRTSSASSISSSGR